MSSAAAIKRTPLFDNHVALGGKMVDFAGWEMPIQYQGIKAEHQAVREQAGLFDVSHMGEVRILGEDAQTFLNYACLNDASKLKIGRGQYSMLPNHQIEQKLSLIYKNLLLLIMSLYRMNLTIGH